MFSKFHQKFSEDLELIYAKYTNPFEGAPELTLSTCDLPENLHILENYSYSNCGKWKVLGADSTGKYEVYHSPDKKEIETSVEDNSGTSDDEYQSSCYNSDDQNQSDSNEIFKLGKSFGEKHSMAHAETQNMSSKNLKHVSKSKPGNYKICDLPTKQLTFENKEKNTEIELSWQDSSDEYFKPERTVTVSKDLWTQVQQCLHLMTSVFSQLNNKRSDEGHSRRQLSLTRRSSVKQNLFNGDNTPQGQVVEKVFVRNKAFGGSGVELASRQSFLHDDKNKISEIESLDSKVCQKNSNDVDKSVQDTCQPESNRASLEIKCRRRYRLVRRRSATGKTPGKSCSKIPMSENKFGTQENRHIGESDHSFDTCLSDTDDFHVSKTIKKTQVKDMGQCERLVSPELDDVVLLEAPPLPVVDKVDSPEAIPRNSKSLSITSFQENIPHSIEHETLFESSQGRCRFSTPQKHSGVNIERSEKRARRPLFPQRSTKSAETMPSPIRSTFNTNLTDESPNHTVISHANDTSLSSCQNVICRDSLPCSIRSKLPCAFLRHEILVNSLTSEHVPKITFSFACNEDKGEHNLEPGQNYCTKHRVQEVNLSHKRFNERSQCGNLIPTSNSVSNEKPDYSESKSKILLSDTNRLLVKSPEGSPTTQHLTTQSKRKSKFLTTEKVKGQHDHSNRLNSPSSNRRRSIIPRRAKFHPYTTCNKSRTPPVVSPHKRLTNKSPSLISPFRKFTVTSPSSSRHKWTTLDRSPTALCVRQTRRMSDPIVVSRRNLEFGDISSDNEKMKAQEKIGFDKMQSESRPNFSCSKFKTQRNNEIDGFVEDDQMRSNCSFGKCTKTFCFNCCMDFS